MQPLGEKGRGCIQKMLVTPPRHRRRWSREAGFLIAVVFFTFSRALFAITLTIAFPRCSAQPLEPRQLSLCEHAAPPGSKISTSPQHALLNPSYRDSSCVSPAPPVCGCTAARLPGNSWHYNPCSPALQFFHKPPPNVCLLVTAGVALWCQVGHPRHLASCPIAGVSSGYRFGVSFWWSVFSRSGAV